MQYAIISSSPDGFCVFFFFFPQPIFNLVYTLVRIPPLEKIASPQAFCYAAAAAVIFVTEKYLTLSDNGI